MGWQQDHALDPVYVIEAIPVPGEHNLTPDEIATEGIPTPKHLRVSKEIGKGAVGHIHVALDRHLLRHVAVKRLDARLAQTPMYRDGFVAEAQITGQLEHPNIVPVHELSMSEVGIPYFTMKLVHGVSFHDWLRDASRPPGSSERLTRGLEIVLKVCDALAYAHARGVIHRDLKPRNVMVGEFGQVYLLDWGLAKLTRTRPASGSLAQMSAVGPVGTPTHCAPEQARGNPDEMDERSDVFGVGALIYEVVTGKPPYGGSRRLDEALDKARAGRVIPMRDVNPFAAIPPALDALVARACAPARDDRYPSILALQDDLRRFVHGGLHLPTRTFAPGKTIVREGDVGDEAFLIVRGACEVTRRRGEDTERLATLGPGDVFGEMALLRDEPRGASVVAKDEVTATVLDRATLTGGLAASTWTDALVRSLATRFAEVEAKLRAVDGRRD